MLKSFIAMICNQFDCSIRIPRPDNGTEFFTNQFSDLLYSLGIIHKNSCPYTTQQNGVVKRKHRHIFEVGRALKLQSHVPRRFWVIVYKQQSI